jgi:hypothetical protein
VTRTHALTSILPVRKLIRIDEQKPLESPGSFGLFRTCPQGLAMHVLTAVHAVLLMQNGDVRQVNCGSKAAVRRVKCERRTINMALTREVGHKR